MARWRRRPRQGGADEKHLVGQGARHVGAAANLAFEVAFSKQLLESIHHRVARHAELCGQLARRLQARAGLELAGENRAAQRFVKLVIQRLWRRRIERQRRVGNGYRVF